MLLTKNELEQLAMDCLCASNIQTDIAHCVSDALVLAELDGLHTHAFSRIPHYADQALSGKVNGQIRPKVQQVAKTAIYVDACNGFAFPAIQQGLKAVAPLAHEMGIAMLGVGHSHHCGVAGHYVEDMAKQGLVCMAFSNTPSAMAPWGGSKATFGTNPLAFACPSKGENPIVIDMALSKVARGKIMTAKQRGDQSIPEGWALDIDGMPTTDPSKALLGTMLPMADAKGAALALMIEILSASLTASSHSYEASSFFEAEGKPPDIGQFFIVLNPFIMNANFLDRITDLCQYMLGQDGVRLPGARRFALREKHLQKGVHFPDALYNELKQRAKN